MTATNQDALEFDRDDLTQRLFDMRALHATLTRFQREKFGAAVADTIEELEYRATRIRELA